MTIKGSNVTIMVKDMDTSISFYKSIGLELKNRWGDHYAMMETAGVTIGIHPGGKGENKDSHVSIGFMIGKAEEGQALLERNKISFKAEDDGKSGKYLHFKDPDGTILYFVEPSW